MNKKIVWVHPPMYPVNHCFFNILAEDVELIVYQIGDHPKFKIDGNLFENRNYTLRLLNKREYQSRRQGNLKILKLLLEDKPDIVVSVAFWLPSFYLSLFNKIFNYKFLITTDATKTSEQELSFLKYIYRKFICWRCDRIIAASNSTLEYIKSVYKNAHVSVSLQTINTKEWIYKIRKLPKKKELRKNLNMPLNKTIILGVGSFQEIKNWTRLIEITKELSDEYYLLLIGEGQLKARYIKYIQLNNLQNKVKILPWVPNSEIIKYYYLSNIFVFPTLKDTFGFVVPEALSAGLPVICSEWAGAKELIYNGYNGFRVDPDKNFFEKINFLKNNLKKFKKNAFRTADKYSLENRVKEHIEIFCNIFE